jgi:hypothetical protein
MRLDSTDDQIVIADNPLFDLWLLNRGLVMII